MESSVTSNVYEKTSSHSRRPFEAGRTPFDGLRLWSAITHGVGILLAMVGTVFLLIKTVPVQDAVRIASFAVFGASMVGLYTASTLYHSVRVGVTGRILLRKVDHTAVYLLIAGTYTPLCMTILNGPLGYTLLAIIWILAIAGGAMSCLWINAPRKVTASVYIALGWLCVIALPFIYQQAGWTPILWMFAGGILYTIGGVLYALKWPGRHNPRFGCHEIFHVFIVLGTIAHFMLVYHCLAFYSIS